MIVSMTGIGRAESVNELFKMSIEIKSYNSRFFDFTPKTPRILVEHDDILISSLKNKLVRGKMVVNVKVEYYNIESELEINQARLKFYINKSNEIKKLINAESSLSVDQIIRFPDIFISSSNTTDIKGVYVNCIKNAIKDIHSARLIEGKNLKKELENYLLKIQKKLNNIASIVELSKENKFDKYKNKVEELLSKKSIIIDEQRLYQEFALLLEKKDIQEELVRLNSHIDLFYNYVKSKDYAGKKLNFLLQEMNREANTICSKTDDIDINHEAIDIKNTLEQIKEQVQNIL